MIATSESPSFWTRHAPLVFAAKTFAAAMLALVIALRLDMPRPYWAMASVYITANPLNGATCSKAIYRVVGTLIGAAGTLALVPNLVDAPELLCLAIAAWLCVFLYLSLIDGTPRSYVFMLAGYTVAFLGFPIVSVPELTFDIVVARVQEITLGILCASMVSMLILPQSVASALTLQVDAWLAAARRLGEDVLLGHSSTQARETERIRLAAAAAEIDTLCRHLGYETTADAATVRTLQRLRLQMLSLLPLLGSIEDRLASFASGEGLAADIAELATRLGRWLTDGAQDCEEASDLRSRLEMLQATRETNAAWKELMIAGLAIRLRDLVDVMLECRAVREMIATGHHQIRIVRPSSVGSSTGNVLHGDRAAALWAAAGTAMSVLACCAVWIATGWPDGASAALLAAAVGSFLAGADDPLPAYRSFSKILLIVIAVTGFYTFAVMPRITSIEMLIAALMPAFLLFGWLAARPATARLGAYLAILISVQLALESSYTASFLSFANSSLALVVGVAVSGVTSGIVRFLGTEWIADRLLRSNWTTLADVAGSRGPSDQLALAALMQHRLALLAARTPAIGEDDRSDAANLRPLRAAVSIIDLRRAACHLSARTRTQIDDLLAGLARACRMRIAGPLPSALVAEIDSTIALILREPAGENGNQALVALTGIRCSLFPDQPTHQPDGPNQERLAA